MRKILVVESGSSRAKGLGGHLTALGREDVVQLATDYDRAIGELENGRFDAVLCAVDESGLDGWSVLKQVHQNAPTTVRLALARDVEAMLPSAAAAHRLVPSTTAPAGIVDIVDRCCNLQGLLVSPSVARLVGSVGTLPSIPQLYAQLIQLLADPEVGLRDLGQVIERDVGIAARILQIANSAFFGLPKQVRTIEQALNYTGVNTVKSLVLSAEVFRAFSDGNGSNRVPVDEMQDHALLTANIARKLPADRAIAEEAFTAAILHDVGKLVLASRLPEEFLENQATAAETQRPLEDIEEDRYGVSHAEIGAYLLALWGLPETLVEAVAHHHAPMRVDHGSFELLDAVHLANHLANETMGDDAEAAGGLDPVYLETLKLEERMDVWREMAAEQAGGAA